KKLTATAIIPDINDAHKARHRFAAMGLAPVLGVMALGPIKPASRSTNIIKELTIPTSIPQKAPLGVIFLKSIPSNIIIIAGTRINELIASRKSMIVGMLRAQ